MQNTRNNWVPHRHLEEVDRKMVQSYPDNFAKRFNNLVKHTRGNGNSTKITKSDGTYVIIGDQPNGNPGLIVVYNNDGTISTTVI